MDPSVGNLDVFMGEICFFGCVGGGLVGCGVGIEVSSLSNELELLEDGCLAASFEGMGLRLALVFLFLGKKEGIMGCPFQFSGQ